MPKGHGSWKSIMTEGHGCSFQGDISKRIPPKLCSELVFKDLLHQNPWQNFPLLLRKRLPNP